jgi:hypothetical protein
MMPRLLFSIMHSQMIRIIADLIYYSWSLCPDISGKDHVLHTLAEIPAFDYFITLFFVLDINIGKSGCLEHPF